MAAARTFRADRGDARERLDLALVRHLADLPEASRSQIQAWIEAGRVRVNGIAAVRPAARLALGDEVEVALSPPPPARPAMAAQELPLSVLFEDEHLLAIDKPAGLVVHPSIGHREGTLINALLWRAREWGGDRRPGLVNRLDRGTSGVLLAAKTPAVHAALARALRSRHAGKEYLAVVYGATPFAKGRIELKILRDPGDRRRMVASKAEGRDSVTLYERLAEGGGLTLLRCRLLTGRTHQIRVHLKAQGLPVVGDPVYGEPHWKGIADPYLAARCRDFPRQALHARRLAFVHPATGAPLEIVAPVPDDMAGLLAAAGLPFGP
ncbi:MAG TPA: RluA family pseudouridine synthase [Thermoanaerobaculia bacterium]|jgi:23S rRNA pseudouridine1911/1915/1917 synthase